MFRDSLLSRLLVLVVSTVLGIILLLVFLKWYARTTGAMITYRYVCEPRPQQWVEDPELGYRNKPNYRHLVFGNIDGATNARGFRTRRDVSLEPKPGVIRIVGIGDSVMEGARVNAEDAFLGALERLASAQGMPIEVINAGVCGYSTYQERLLFEREIVPLHPQIVIVNFSPNDLLPTEDPFGNLRPIYLRYLERLLQTDRDRLSEVEQAGVRDIIALLQIMPKAQEVLNYLNNDLLRKVFLEIPILEMKEIADQQHITFVYVFIAKDDQSLKGFMKASRIDIVDCSSSLAEAPAHRQPTVGLSLTSSVVHVLKQPGLQSALRCLSFMRLDPVRALQRVAELNTFRYQQSHRCWIDREHPSRKGNAIIAQAIYEHLKHEGVLP